MAQEDDLERTEVEAVLETRRELGLRYDAELVDGFADRIERAVDERVSAGAGPTHAGRRGRRERRSAAARARDHLAGRLPSRSASRWACNGEFGALIVAMAGIVAINYAHAWQSKR